MFRRCYNKGDGIAVPKGGKRCFCALTWLRAGFEDAPWRISPSSDFAGLKVTV